jgi:formylglycine-generating enzyme required for sulfatase activity
VCNGLKTRVAGCLNKQTFKLPPMVSPDERKLIAAVFDQLDCNQDCKFWSAEETTRLAQCNQRQPCEAFESCITAGTKSGVKANPKTKKRKKDGAEMVFVPAGKFYRGSPERLGEADENPGGLIGMSAFWIDRTEVTVGQYTKCMEAHACMKPGTSPLCNYGKPKRERHPINCVNWYGAERYCQWAGATLPTEAQWEKAARGPGGRLFPWLGLLPSCNKLVWFDAKFGKACGQHGTWAVGSKAAGTSVYGAVDMGGNVWEWVLDPYDAEFYASEEKQDPVNAETGSLGVLRGGSWGDDEYNSWLTSNRHQFLRYRRNEQTGFRCAMAGQ